MAVGNHVVGEIVGNVGSGIGVGYVEVGLVGLKVVASLVGVALLSVGVIVGRFVGFLDGALEGILVGSFVGTFLGSFDGVKVGI